MGDGTAQVKNVAPVSDNNRRAAPRSTYIDCPYCIFSVFTIGIPYPVSPVQFLYSLVQIVQESNNEELARKVESCVKIWPNFK